MPNVENQIQKMTFYYVNSQPYLDFPIVEKLLKSKHIKLLPTKQNDKLLEVNTNANKVKFFGGLSLERPSKATVDKVLINVK